MNKRKVNFTILQSIGKSQLPFITFVFLINTLNFIKKILLFFIFLGCIQFAKTQNITHRNTFYAEFFSRDVYYSINYDRVFSEGKKINKSYRAGFSVSGNTIALPLGINFFSGYGNGHFEFGLTLMPYIEDYQKLFSPGNLSDKKLDIIPGAGYRFQKPGGGFFFKIIGSPIIHLDPPSDNFWKMDGKLYAGISIGVGISF